MHWNALINPRCTCAMGTLVNLSVYNLSVTMLAAIYKHQLHLKLGIRPQNVNLSFSSPPTSDFAATSP